MKFFHRIAAMTAFSNSRKNLDCQVSVNLRDFFSNAKPYPVAHTRKNARLHNPKQ